MNRKDRILKSDNLNLSAEIPGGNYNAKDQRFPPHSIIDKMLFVRTVVRPEKSILHSSLILKDSLQLYYQPENLPGGKISNCNHELQTALVGVFSVPDLILLR